MLWKAHLLAVTLLASKLLTSHIQDPQVACKVVNTYLQHLIDESRCGWPETAAGWPSSTSGGGASRNTESATCQIGSRLTILRQNSWGWIEPPMQNAPRTRKRLQESPIRAQGSEFPRQGAPIIPMKYASASESSLHHAPNV